MNVFISCHKALKSINITSINFEKTTTAYQIPF